MDKQTVAQSHSKILNTENECICPGWVAQSVTASSPTCQDCRSDPQSGHTQETTNNHLSLSLSPPPPHLPSFLPLSLPPSPKSVSFKKN